MLGEFYDDPVRSVGINDRHAMVVWVRLTKNMIKGLVDVKKLFIGFHVDSSVEEESSGSRVTFAEVASKGSTFSEDSFEFLVL